MIRETIAPVLISLVFLMASFVGFYYLFGLLQ